MPGRDDAALVMDGNPVNISEDEELEGETERGSGFVINDDGSLTFDEDEGEQEPQDLEFYSNIIDEIGLDAVRMVAFNLHTKIIQDIEDRKPRDIQYKEGLERTGINGPAPGGADFEGASRVTHPILTEGCIDYAARTKREICPPSGPVKAAPYITDEMSSQEKEDRQSRAERKAKYLNYQIQKVITEFVPELEQALVQEPMAGDSYLLFWHDRRIRCEFVSEDRVILPFNASGWSSAERRSIRLEWAEEEFARRVKYSGWRDINATTTANSDPTDTSKILEKHEGKTESGVDRGTVSLIRVEFRHSFEDDKAAGGEEAPYILILDAESGEPICLERNWKDDDDDLKPLPWVVRFPFIPWIGAYSIGFPHIIGGLTSAVTGSLRALMDSAFASSAPTLILLRGAGKHSGQNVRLQIGKMNPIEASAGNNDIRNHVYAPPYNPPSTVLYQLFIELIKEAKGVVRTAMDSMAEEGTNVPVGTQLSRVEQGLMVFSTIHERQHRSMGEVIEIIHRLNSYHLEDEDVIEELGGLVVRPEDFQGPCDVGPVSDPRTFSEVQRINKAQVVLARADAKPALYDQAKTEKYFLRAMRIDDADELLRVDPEPKDTDPINENMMAALGKPIKAYEHQDHETHFIAHVAYMSGLLLTPLMAMPALPLMIAHLKEHAAYWYKHVVGKEIAKISMVYRKMGMPQPELGDAIKHASREAMVKFTGEMQQLTPLIEQGMKLVQSMAPQDPANQANAAQIIQAQAAAKVAEAEMIKAQTAGMKAQMESQLNAQKAKLEQIRAMVDFKAQDQANELAERGMMLADYRTSVDQAIEAVRVAVDSEENQIELMLKASELAARAVDGFNSQVLDQIKEFMGEVKPDKDGKRPKPTSKKIVSRRGADNRLNEIEVDKGDGNKVHLRVERGPDNRITGVVPVETPL